MANEQGTAGEVWKPVVGSDMTYSVSSLGRVRRDIPVRNRPAGTILKPFVREYAAVNISLADGSRKCVKVHAMVAAAFIGPRPKGLTVNHKDGNRLNNCVDNLEYMTVQDNVRHSIRVLGNVVYGENNGYRSLNDDAVRRLRAVKGILTQTEACRAFMVAASCVRSVWQGKSWAHVV